jgi:predicted GNAT family acetyltransferase
MIRRLTELDRQSVLDYLYQEQAFNIFPIGDIETFGFDKDFQRVYADFDSMSNYKSVFLRYRNNAIYYSKTNDFNPDYFKIFKDDPFDFISGKAELFEMIESALKDFRKDVMYFVEADTLRSNKNNFPYEIKQLKTAKEAEKLFYLFQKIKEFAPYHSDLDNFIEAKMNSINMGMTLYIEDSGKIIASAGSTAETTKSAMVVAVATDPNYRKLGLASNLLEELLRIYLTQKKKTLCLFYDNPEAGSIYKRLGFKYLGMWNIYRKRK